MPDVTFTMTDKEYEALEKLATVEERETARQAKVFVLQAIKKWPPKPEQNPQPVALPKAALAKVKATELSAVTHGSVGDGA